MQEGNLEASSNLFVYGGVDGGDLDLPLELGGRLRPVGCQMLAVAAPERKRAEVSYLLDMRQGH